MRYVRYENEKTITDLVNRLLPAKGKRLTSERRAAEETLAKMNPHLADIHAIDKGAPILLPDTPAFRDAPGESLMAPVQEMLARFRTALEEAQKHIEATSAAHVERASDDLARLRSRDVKKAVGESEEAADSLARVADARAAQLARAKVLKTAGRKMISMLQKNLDEVAKCVE